MRYCIDWKPEARPSWLRNIEYSAGVIVASTSHDCTSCAWMRETRASILNDGPRSSRRMCSRAAVSSCRHSFIHSSEAWWMMMNSISSCSTETGFCTDSSWSSPRYWP
jgi:hypothetical protein